MSSVEILWAQSYDPKMFHREKILWVRILPKFLLNLINQKRPLAFLQKKVILIGDGLAKTN
jgi:hypothetical protein